MARRRDPNFHTGHLCRFCGRPVPWGTILRLLRVDPDTPPYMQNESACHTECLLGLLRPDVPLTMTDRHCPPDSAACRHRRRNGKPPLLDDSADLDDRPCAMCARDIAPAKLVRLRVHQPHAGMPPACRNG